MSDLKETIDNKLLYNQSNEVVKAVIQRELIRYYPRTAQSGIGLGSVMEFITPTDQVLDLASFALSFTLNIYGPIAADVNAADIANILDCIERVKITYNGQTLEEILDINAWNNLFLTMNSNEMFFKHEGSMLLKNTNQFINSNKPWAVSSGAGYEPAAMPGAPNGGASYPGMYVKSRTFSVPLSLLCNIAKMPNYLPIFGNEFQIQLFLTNDLRTVLSVAGTPAVPPAVNNVANTNFSISSPSLTGDVVVLESKYKRSLMNLMSSDEGIILPWTSFETNRLNAVQASTFNLQLHFSLSNALALVLMLDDKAGKIATSVDKWALVKQSYPLTDCTSNNRNNFDGNGRFEVICGSRYFTVPGAIQSQSELFVSATKCISSFLDIGGHSLMDYKTFTGNYVPQTDTTAANAVYGLTPLAVNLQKSLTSDYYSPCISDGITSSSNGASNEFMIRIQLNNSTTSQATWLTNIIHKRQLRFSNSTCIVEY